MPTNIPESVWLALLAALFGLVRWIGKSLERAGQRAQAEREARSTAGRDEERRKREALEAAQTALDRQEQELRQELRAEFERQNKRIVQLEQRIDMLERDKQQLHDENDRLRRFVRVLVSIMEANGLTVPPMPGKE